MLGYLVRIPADYIVLYAYLLTGVLLKKWANPGLFFVYFRLFKQTIQFLQQINVKKCPSSIRRRDSNSQPIITSLLPQPPDQGSRPIN